LGNGILGITRQNAVAEELIGIEIPRNFHCFVDVVFFSDVIHSYGIAVLMLEDFIQQNSVGRHEPY
jgi:hypothetical protein